MAIDWHAISTEAIGGVIAALVIGVAALVFPAFRAWVSRALSAMRAMLRARMEGPAWLVALTGAYFVSLGALGAARLLPFWVLLLLAFLPVVGALILRRRAAALVPSAPSIFIKSTDQYLADMSPVERAVLRAVAQDYPEQYQIDHSLSGAELVSVERAVDELVYRDLIFRHGSNGLRLTTSGRNIAHDAGFMA
jgi:hypothetical protein